MGNIVSYIQQHQQNFEESSFNDVDSLVFSTLAYFNFEVSEPISSTMDQRVLLHDIVALSNWRKLSSCSWLQDAKDTRAFLHVLMASRRYRGVEVAFYVNEHSRAVEKQFSASTFLVPVGQKLSERKVCLSFRGTDGSFAGWKEDFNLCFKSVIPSQRAACAYLSGVASATEGPLVLTGHSKGGNLAEFAAAVADKEVYRRIQGIYNHDGPSFLDDPSPRMEQSHFKKLLHKAVPESSAFGMILERRSNYRVVKSTASSVFQHEPFSWLVKDQSFVYQEALNPSARFFDDALDKWLRSKNPDERERFIDAIYDLFASTNANTWPQFHSKLLANTRQMLGVGSKLDAETRDFILHTLAGLGSVLKDETIKRFRPEPFAWLPRRKERYDSGEGEDAKVKDEDKRKKELQKA